MKRVGSTPVGMGRVNRSETDFQVFKVSTNTPIPNLRQAMVDTSVSFQNIHDMAEMIYCLESVQERLEN